eukprot:Filipodium_phascolosomae@DN7698_c0_g1_i1.p1
MFAIVIGMVHFSARIWHHIGWPMQSSRAAIATVLRVTSLVFQRIHTVEGACVFEANLNLEAYSQKIQQALLGLLCGFLFQCLGRFAVDIFVRREGHKFTVINLIEVLKRFERLIGASPTKTPLGMIASTVMKGRKPIRPMNSTDKF